MNEIKIRCKGAVELDYRQLNELQGNLKELSERDYKSLRKEILDTGFAFTPHIWRDSKKKYHLIDGHQRIRAVKTMVEKEGFSCAPIPCSIVEANDIKEAKRRVLQGTSQYGRMTEDGLYEFANNAELSLKELTDNFRLPDVDMAHFEVNFFADQVSEEISSSVILNNKNEIVDLGKLKSHPRNFRSYPDDLVKHISSRVREIGIYRNVVVSSDYTILIGHGIVEAVKKMNFKTLPVKKLKYDKEDIRALKILLNDDDLNHLCEVDDRKLTEIIKFIKDNSPTGLSGTGYDEKMLASLVMVTRPENEIKDMNEAAEWTGMPEYENSEESFKLMIAFEKEAQREKFIKQSKIKTIHRTSGKMMSTWWPDKPKADQSSIKFSSGKKK